MSRNLLGQARASIGLQLMLGGACSVALSLIALRPPMADVARLLGVGVATLIVALTARRLLRERRSLVVLATIGVVLAGLASTGLVTNGYLTVFSAPYVLVFIYAGCNLPSGLPSALSLPAACCWLVTNLPIDESVVSRLPGVLVVIVVVGECLSAHTTRGRRRSDALREQAERDALTGLLNRHRLEQHLSRVQAGDAVVLLDLDHFKTVNDTFGHAAGDAVLADLGRVVLSVSRPGDVAVRYGGEEVLLLLPRAGAAGADRLLARLRAGWSASHPELTFSAGVTVSGGNDADGVLDRADAALYAAKSNGRNRTEHDSATPHLVLDLT